MKKLLTLITAFVMLFAMGTAAAGCSDKNTITMYTNAEFAPYEFIEGGKIVGVDVKIAEKIAERLGKKLKIENLDFDALTPKLSLLKDNEMILAGMTITPARQEHALFSNEYAKSIQYIIYKTADGLDTVEKLAGKKVGVQTATTGDYLLTDELSEPLDIDVVRLGSAALAALSLNRGELDAVMVDKLPAEMIAENYNNFSAVAAVYEIEGENLFAEEAYGVAVKKDNTALKATIDEVIAELIADGSIERWTKEFTGVLTE